MNMISNRQTYYLKGFWVFNILIFLTATFGVVETIPTRNLSRNDHAWARQYVSSQNHGWKMHSSNKHALKILEKNHQYSSVFTVSNSVQITVPLIITGTRTAAPIPTFTLLFPTVTAPSQLLFAERDVEDSGLSKNTTGRFQTILRRFWPFIVLVVLWIVLLLWYVFSQMMIE